MAQQCTKYDFPDLVRVAALDGLNRALKDYRLAVDAKHELGVLRKKIFEQYAECIQAGEKEKADNFLSAYFPDWRKKSEEQTRILENIDRLDEALEKKLRKSGTKKYEGVILPKLDLTRNTRYLELGARRAQMLKYADDVIARAGKDIDALMTRSHKRP